jgi:hypothetical protein
MHFTVHDQGISFSDLMYVTKRNMANAVSSMTKHLEQVQSSLAVSTYFFPNLSQELCHQLHNVATMTPSLLFSKMIQPWYNFNFSNLCFF